MPNIAINKKTVLKFDKPGPRYTSYPTAPEWNNSVNQDTYIHKLKMFGKSAKSLSLYIHIPFCQTMCTYCACNVVIRRLDEKYGDAYIEYVAKEIDLVRKHIGQKKKIKQFHWGGGTPTYLDESQIERLFNKVKNSFDIDFDSEVAIEIDPRTIDKSKIRKLKEVGFNRISMGVQDFNENVQKKVNRVQPYELVKGVYEYCREVGFTSINFDLIYGLPGQSAYTFHDTVKKVVALKPDRIALYSFAYVPWLKKHQGKIEQADLPDNNTKLELFVDSRDTFLESGYMAIAMDHFALKEDEMAQAFQKDTLYRNFMGYTVKPADEFIGLGLTSIGFLENAFIQNHKTLPDYYAALDRGELPVERGKLLTEDDRIRQWVISSFMCKFRLDKKEFLKKFNMSFDQYFAEETGHVRRCVDDQLILEKDDSIVVTELGKIFIRNVCMGFDWYLKQKDSHKRFSKTV